MLEPTPFNSTAAVPATPTPKPPLTLRWSSAIRHWNSLSPSPRQSKTAQAGTLINLLQVKQPTSTAGGELVGWHLQICS